MEGILLLIFGSIGLGFFLIFLLGLDEKRRKSSLPVIEGSGLTQIQFEKACVEVIERMKLTIDSIERNEEHALEIKAKNPTPFTGGDFFVTTIYLPRGEVVTSAEILEVSSMIIQDRLSKGILMTNTKFTDDLSSLSELAPLEFVDGEKLKELMSKYSVVTA